MSENDAPILQDSPNSAINPGETSPNSATLAVPEEQEGHYRVLSNGAKADMVTGRIVTGPRLDGAGARDLVARRQAKAQAAVRRAITAADTTHALGQQSVYGGVATIAAAQVELALSPEAGRAATEAAKFLLRHGGLAQDDAGAASVPAVRLELGAAAVEALGRLLARRDGGLARRQQGSG